MNEVAMPRSMETHSFMQWLNLNVLLCISSFWTVCWSQDVRYFKSHSHCAFHVSQFLSDINENILLACFHHQHNRWQTGEVCLGNLYSTCECFCVAHQNCPRCPWIYCFSYEHRWAVTREDVFEVWVNELTSNRITKYCNRITFFK